MSYPKPIVRFAPSPTGFLHIGNVRTALINWLFARREKGTFILRFDDTDLERSKPEYGAAIESDLAWLGLSWDQSFCQSARLDHYAAAADHLKKSGRLYPCYETSIELDLKRKRQLGQGLPPVYDRSALTLTPDDHAQMAAHGRKAHWRFRLDLEQVTWNDLSHGPMVIDTHSMSDPVLIREDGSPVYTLSSVVDDLETGVTHILRGDDHISNTAVQIQLYEALGGVRSGLTFGHTPLIVGEDGKNLSKRLGKLGIGALRDDGIEPLALLSYLAKLGTSDDIVPSPSLDALIAGFDRAHYGKSSPRFSVDTLKQLNGKLLHGMSYDAVLPRLTAMGFSNVSRDMWAVFRGNITSLSDIGALIPILTGPIVPVISDPAFAKTALSLLPDGPLTPDTWGVWTSLIKAETGFQGRALFMPLRLALTGMEHGPDMKSFLPFFNRTQIIARLQGESA